VVRKAAWIMHALWPCISPALRVNAESIRALGRSGYRGRTSRSTEAMETQSKASDGLTLMLKYMLYREVGLVCLAVSASAAFAMGRNDGFGSRPFYISRLTRSAALGRCFSRGYSKADAELAFFRPGMRMPSVLLKYNAGVRAGTGSIRVNAASKGSRYTAEVCPRRWTSRARSKKALQIRAHNDPSAARTSFWTTNCGIA
jgi:transposase